jgi:hypothetical protein
MAIINDGQFAWRPLAVLLADAVRKKPRVSGAELPFGGRGDPHFEASRFRWQLHDTQPGKLLGAGSEYNYTRVSFS